MDQDFILRIVDKFLAELEQKLALKNVEIEVLTAAKKWLADNGYDPQMGARPLLRLIDVKIKKTLSREVLFGSLSHGGKVIIGLNKEKNELKFDYCTKNS